MPANQLHPLFRNWVTPPHRAAPLVSHPQLDKAVNFFIPFAADEAQAQRILLRTIDNLTSASYQPLKALVYQVNYLVDGHLVSQSVGQVSVVNEEIIMLIFKNDRGYLVCTYSRGVSWGHPIIAHYVDVNSVIMFNAPEDDGPIDSLTGPSFSE